MRTLVISMLLIFSQISFAANNESKMLLDNEKNTIDVFQNNVNSVVHISNIKKARRGWFDVNPMEIPAGAGSGFIWDNKGHIVTNCHVVAGGDAFIIRFHKDKKKYRAKYIGGDPTKDIAILKLKDIPKNLTPVAVGSSKNLRVGQKALAIGNPFGMDHSLSSGIISALERKIRGYADVNITGMIQTDTSINPGNSGGPLLNSRGQLIGMNTMIYSASGSSAGVGFAVPVDTVNRIVPQIINNGKISKAGLGIIIISDYYNDYFGVKKGVIVKSVKEGSPADKVGLQGLGIDRYRDYVIGDVIVGINNTEIKDRDDLLDILGNLSVGDIVTVSVLRNSKKKTFKIKLISI